MEKIEEKNIGYQFTPIPTNLMACLDNNCRNMLWTLIQLSSYYADNEGWFFRTNEDLKAQCGLGEKVVRACLSTLHNIGILEVKSVGKGNGKIPNYYRLVCDKFKDWEKIPLEDCIKHPKYKIETEDYKAKDWTPSYLSVTRKEEIEVKDIVQSSAQSADNIDNIEIKNNYPLYEDSEHKTQTQFEEYKQREDYLMDRLCNVNTLEEFALYRQQIDDLILTASTETIAKWTRKRLEKIERGKKSYLRKNANKTMGETIPNDLSHDQIGKESDTTDYAPPNSNSNENPNCDTDARILTMETLAQYGIEIPSEDDFCNPDNITRVRTAEEIAMEDELPF